jgi:hypothetical protein
LIKELFGPGAHKVGITMIVPHQSARHADLCSLPPPIDSSKSTKESS